jgi:SAM-dependent methyltransferase
MGRAATGLSWKGYEGQDYEQFWVGPGKQYVDELERAIVSHVLPGGNSLVEIGAGFGRLAPSYVGKYAHIHLVEPASNLREAARAALGDEIEYHEASAEALPFADSSLDAALMVRVFHHLGNPEAALKEIHRVLRPGGLLVFNFSNKRNIKRVLRYAVRRGESPFTRDIEQYHESLLGHHPRYVDDLLRSAGFSVKARYSVGMADKLVSALPFLHGIVRPSLPVSRFFGAFELAPSQFLVAVKI